MVVPAAAVVAGEGRSIEQPEHMHGKRVLLRELMHDDLKDELGEAFLDFQNPAFEFAMVEGPQRARGIRNQWGHAWHRTEQGAGPGVAQAAGRALRSACQDLGIAEWATHCDGL